MTLVEALEAFGGAEQYVDVYRVGVSEFDGAYSVYVAKGLMPPHFTADVKTPEAALVELGNMAIDPDGWQEPQEF